MMNEEQMMMVLDAVEELRTNTMAEIATLRAERVAYFKPDTTSEEE